MKSPLRLLSFGAIAVCACILVSPAVKGVDCTYSMGVSCPPDMDPTSFVNGLQVVLNGGVGSDDELCPPAANINWDWGDGTLEPSFFPAYHEYVAPGDYEIVVSATDESDVELATASCNLSVDQEFDGLHSVNLGYGAISPGYTSTAIGYFASSYGYQGTAIGHGASANGASSIALGFDSIATNDAGTALGAYAVSERPWTIVLGSIAGVNFAGENTDVAIGTTWPTAPLHICRADATQELLLLESNEVDVTQDRPMIQLINNGGIRFQFDNVVQGTAWRFQAATGNQDNFEITKVGTGQIEFKVDADGNAYLAGLLFESSDRNAKTNIHPVDPEAILEKVTQMPISHWAYKEAPDSHHIGPMAQDFRAAFGTGRNDTTLATMDTSGVALASIKALETRSRKLSTENEALLEEVAVLKQEMQELKDLLLRLSPPVALNH